MNLLVLGILAFILLLVFRGYRKGFFKSAAKYNNYLPKNNKLI